MTSRHAFLLAYFHPESDPDGEQIRFAVSDPGDPCRWTPIGGGSPILRSTVGEGGARDPFLVRTPDGEIVVLATDLRIGEEGDWTRAVTNGSRAILVWRTRDLRRWTGPSSVVVAPPEAGNAWAPKAVWSPQSQSFHVTWASALYPAGERESPTHQRLVTATTRDFRVFSAPAVSFDPGHDVLDAQIVPVGAEGWLRFSVNTHGGGSDRGRHIFLESGRDLAGDGFEPVTVDIGKPHLVHGEGPGVFVDPESGTWYLLIDEFGHSGLNLFRTDDPLSGTWRPVEAALPERARHGSVLVISSAEREAALLEGLPGSGV